MCSIMKKIFRWIHAAGAEKSHPKDRRRETEIRECRRDSFRDQNQPQPLQTAHNTR